MKILIQSDVIDDNVFSDYKTHTEEINIGTGADWYLTAVTIIGALGTVFLAGKKIEENLVAWQKIGKRLKNLFNKKNHSTVFIDISGAIALSINEISSKINKIKSIELVSEVKLSEGYLDEVFNDNRVPGDLCSAPYNYYILVFRVNNENNFIFCIKSNGEIKHKDIFNDAWFDYSNDWNNFKER